MTLKNLNDNFELMRPDIFQTVKCVVYILTDLV